MIIPSFFFFRVIFLKISKWIMTKIMKNISWLLLKNPCCFHPSWVMKIEWFFYYRNVWKYNETNGISTNIDNYIYLNIRREICKLLLLDAQEIFPTFLCWIILQLFLDENSWKYFLEYWTTVWDKILMKFIGRILTENAGIPLEDPEVRWRNSSRYVHRIRKVMTDVIL